MVGQVFCHPVAIAKTLQIVHVVALTGIGIKEKINKKKCRFHVSLNQYKSSYRSFDKIILFKRNNTVKHNFITLSD